MKKHLINNFTGRDPLTVMAAESELSRKEGGLVHIIQDIASLRLQHDMTTAQARQMAAALLEAADDAEAFAAQVAA